MKAVMLETRVVQMKAEPAGIRVTFDGGQSGDAVFDRVLVAVGRRPNASVPGLDRTQVRLDERGFIVVDEQMRTAEPSIFAIGDVVGEPMLAHRAMAQGEMVAEIVAGRRRAWDKRCIPAVCFTDPEIVASYVLGRFREPHEEVEALVERAADETERLIAQLDE